MCEICMKNPCDPRCPNAPEPDPELKCTWCHSGIMSGEKYLMTEEGPMCEDCVDEMSVRDFMELVGEKFSIA